MALLTWWAALGPSPVAAAVSSGGYGPAFHDLLRLELAAGTPYVILRLSPSISYAQFDSPETRQIVFEGISPAGLASWRSDAALTMPLDTLRVSYAAVGNLSGMAGDFRNDLTASGFFDHAEPPSSRALITAVRSAGGPRMFDFSYSRRLQAVTERQDSLDRLEGRSTAETGSLSTAGADHPTVATFESWRFDNLDQGLEDGGAEREETLPRAARAMLTAELIHALGLVDPGYEAAIIRWVESELGDEDRRRLVQLLQLVGFREVRPETFVRELPAQLFDSAVLVGGMYQQLESVTTSARRGLRKLDPARFRDRQVLKQAAAFYSQFFVTNARGEYSFSLNSEMWEFVGRHSTRIREISAPFIGRQLGPAWQLSLAGPPQAP